MKGNAYKKSTKVTLIHVAVGLGGGVVPFILKLFFSDPLMFGIILLTLVALFSFISAYIQRND